jgi:CubicO group peptidase (beta-lactamase class C family)
MRRTVLSIIAIIGLCAAGLQNKNTMKTINQYLQQQVEGKATPSIQYMFFDTDSMVYEYRSGLKNVKDSVPVDENTRYHLFSVTKTFTALAVLQLAQSGQLELDRPVVEYLPDFPYGKVITVEHLLSHTAGIPNPMPLRWVHREGEHASFRHDEFFANIFKKHPDLKFEPGTAFKYSNLGYVILGQLVEKLSGLSFEEYVLRSIVDRSGIDRKDLNFTLDTALHATGYQKWLSFNNAIFGLLIDKKKFMGPREGDWKPFQPFYNNGKAYGGMFGTGKALVKYAQALMKADSELLREPYKRILFTEPTINGKATGMAHSWFTGMLKGNKYFAHAGGGGGYYVELRIYPDLGVGSVILFNRSGIRDERILNQTDQSFIAGKTMESITTKADGQTTMR